VQVDGASFSIGDELALFTFLPSEGPLVDVKCSVKNYYDTDCYGFEFQKLSLLQERALASFEGVFSRSIPATDRTDTNQVMTGDLRYISLPDFLQTLVKSGKNYQVDVVNESELGRIFIRGGEIYYAESSSLIGEDAMYELFSQSEAQCRVQEARRFPKPNIRLNLDQLILKFVHLIDKKVIGCIPPSPESQTDGI
jgi:hypothetical protein